MFSECWAICRAEVKVQKIGEEKIPIDIRSKSTTIWLWID